MPRGGLHKSGRVEASEAGRLVEGTQSSVSRNTAEIGRVRVEHMIVLVEQSL